MDSYVPMTEAKRSVQSVCSCPCGHTQITIMGEPLLRVLCHCKICQEVYGAAFADFVMLRLSQITQPLEPGIRFARHRAPPNVNRGICASCLNPVIALMTAVPFFGLACIPTINLPTNAKVLEPALHSFYDRRVKDVHDELPKYCGYGPSQWAVMRRFISAWLFQGAR